MDLKNYYHSNLGTIPNWTAESIVINAREQAVASSFLLLFWSFSKLGKGWESPGLDVLIHIPVANRLSHKVCVCVCVFTSLGFNTASKHIGCITHTHNKYVVFIHTHNPPTHTQPHYTHTQQHTLLSTCHHVITMHKHICPTSLTLSL